VDADMIETKIALNTQETKQLIKEKKTIQATYKQSVQQIKKGQIPQTQQKIDELSKNMTRLRLIRVDGYRETKKIKEALGEQNKEKLKQSIMNLKNLINEARGMF
jgi:K+ transporter